jgi:outer membrane protein assembly factor BamE
MRIQASSAARRTLLACAVLALAGCGSFNRTTERLMGSITPFKIEVVQGNFVSKEQVAALQKGMSRTQVRDLLGTPLIADAFHKDRWDYVFTIKRQGVEAQQRKFTVYVDGEALARFEGDDMPSEADFVATLDAKRSRASVPPLEASEEKLKQFAAENKQPAAAPQPPPAAAVTNYPPLEPPQR